MPRTPDSAALVMAMLLVANASGARAAERRVELPIVEGSDIAFSRVSFATASSQINVQHIVQDDAGFLWFGTQQGLRRYDGYDLRPFRPDPDNPESLSGNFVASLFKDSSGSLWIGSDGFLDRYNPKREAFSHYTDRVKGPVYRMTEDRDGTLWVCTDEGLNRLDRATGRSTRYTHQPGSPGTLPGDLVRASLEDKDGTFWVVTAQGVNVFDRAQGKVIRYFPFDFQPGSGPISLFEDHARVFWLNFSAGNGLASLDPTTGKYTQYETSVQKTGNSQLSGVSSIYEDVEGVLWLGTYGRGILKPNRERTSFTQYRHIAADPSSLGNDTVYTLFEDREGIMWVGTAAGVNRFARQHLPFRTYRHIEGNSQSLAADNVLSIFEDSRGTLWVGARGGLNEVRRSASTYSSRTFPGPDRGGLSNPSVFSIAEDPSGDLWFGTFGGGLNRFDPQTRRVQVFQHDPARDDSLSHEYPSSLYVDRKGTLWVGTDVGLDRFDRNRNGFTHFRPDVPGLPRYHSIKEDRRGALWLASWGIGLHRFEPSTGKFATYMHKPGDSNSLSNDRTNSICVDREGIIWVGTSSGLNRFDPKTGAFRAFYEEDGLPDNTVFSILEDHRGDLWVTTGKGLSRYDRARNAFRNYSVADGLPGNESSWFPAAWQSANGEMFFGLLNGAISFFPKQIVDNTPPPPVVLTDFRLFGAPVAVGRGSVLNESISTASLLTLPHFLNTFSLEFAALSLHNPERNRYRFRLEPMENRWNETGSHRRFTTYTTVAPGDYVFRVQASDAHGVWNENGASVHIQVLPPWWSTWWFRGALLAALCTLLWAAYRYRLQQIEREFQAQMEGRVDERLRVARELHDTLLQSFHGLLLRFQGVHNLLPGRVAEAQQILEAAIERAAEALVEARDAVQDLRASTAVTNDLVQAIETVGRELGAHERSPDAAATAFSVEVEGTPQNLHPILRDEIYCIAREALRNAFRHAQAGRIEVEIRYEAQELRVRVRDDGIGIDPGMLGNEGRPGHWGFSGMRERAKRIGGHFEVWSESGAGTEIELTVPASATYQGYTRRRFRLVERKVGRNS